MAWTAQIARLFKFGGLRRNRAAMPFKDLFVRFHQVLEENTKAMEIITEMEDKLGGEYVFDRKFLEDTVQDIKAVILRSAYHFNAITNNKYSEIYEVIESLIRQLQQESSGQLVFSHRQNVVALTQINDTMGDVVGNKAYKLSKIVQLPQTAVPPGVVVTVMGFRNYLAYNNLFDEITPLLASCQQGGRELEPVSQKIRLLVLGSEIPPDLRQEILKAAELVCPDRPESGLYSVRSSAVGEDGELSFAGLHDTLLNVAFRDLLSSYKKVLASLYNPAALEYRIKHQIPFSDMSMAVLYQKMVPARVSGVTYSIDPNAPHENVCLVTATWGLGSGVVEGSAAADTFRLSREPPYPILSSRIAASETVSASQPAGPISDSPHGKPRRPFLAPETASSLVETALILERFFKHPLDIEWSIDAEGRIWILQARPLGFTRSSRPRSPELKNLLRRYPEIIKDTGTIAYRGIGAGPVWIAREGADLEDFPTGAVLVSRYSLPVLARVIPRASAVITDVGSPTGHMATVAREFRIPTIVDTGSATEILKSGQLVTVDAERNVVYEGRIEELLHYQLLERASFETTYEFQLLRRMLKRIAPLTLVNPEDPDFTVAGCRTLHDVLRFIHEKSIEALVRIAQDPRTLLKHGGRRLKANLPLNLILIDIGGGLEENPGRSNWVEPRQIKSLPMLALWAGMDAPDVWDTEPVAADFKGLVSSLTRTQTTALSGHILTGLNVAVLSKNYLNLTLRVGYHFTVVDASLWPSAENSSIFFRFIGGAADITRRSRRAALLGSILEEFCFKVEKKGDLVIARAINCTEEQMRAHLYVIGRLIGFIRQLDILMRDDGTVDHYFKRFMADHRRAFQGGNN
ncbi:MAG: PEP/pyruvate-binding domain-containing protein [Desulfobacterales bacterium]|jgi:pyruvate,water dikinase